MGEGEDYSRMSDCSAQGCRRNVHDVNDGIVLTRISPTGGPFVGLCQDHIDKTVVLKKGAQQVLENNQEVS